MQLSNLLYLSFVPHSNCPRSKLLENRGVIVLITNAYTELFKRAVCGPVQMDLYKEVAALLK